MIRNFFSIFVIALGVFAPSAYAENVYERVMRTRTIECGYFIEPPFTLKDESTGKFSGVAVELTEEIAKNLGLKVHWKEQVNFATFPQDLNQNKFDMVCGSVFVLPRAGRIDYSLGYAYAPMYGYVKKGNTAFNKPFKEIDWSKVTTAGIDGEGATEAILKRLPEAKMTVLPQFSNISEILLAVQTGKADIGFVLPTVFENFEKNNPGKVTQAQLDEPIYTYEVTFGLPQGQEEFKAMINNGLRQLITSGELGALFNKYDLQGFFQYPAVHKR